MQEGWGEAESSVSASRHSSWEEEEESGGGGVWNNAGSQGSGSSYNSSGWGQGHSAKKVSKVCAMCWAGTPPHDMRRLIEAFFLHRKQLCYCYTQLILLFAGGRLE